MAYSSSKSARACVSDDHHHRNLTETSIVEQEETSKYIKTFKCIACRLNLHFDVEYGQRRSMADCGICRRVLELRGLMVNGETYMASTGIVHQTPSLNLNLTLATSVYDPPPPPPSPSSAPLPSSPPPTFIDFLGIGSV